MNDKELSPCLNLGSNEAQRDPQVVIDSHLRNLLATKVGDLGNFSSTETHGMLQYLMKKLVVNQGLTNRANSSFVQVSIPSVISSRNSNHFSQRYKRLTGCAFGPSSLKRRVTKTRTLDINNPNTESSKE